MKVNFCKGMLFDDDGSSDDYDNCDDDGGNDEREHIINESTNI